MIAPALRSVEIERAQRKPTASLTAFDLYLQALPRYRTSLAENREALRLLDKAIALDPSYSTAYGFEQYERSSRSTHRSAKYSQCPVRRTRRNSWSGSSWLTRSTSSV